MHMSPYGRRQKAFFWLVYHPPINVRRLCGGGEIEVQWSWRPPPNKPSFPKRPDNVSLPPLIHAWTWIQYSFGAAFLLAMSSITVLSHLMELIEPVLDVVMVTVQAALFSQAFCAYIRVIRASKISLPLSLLDLVLNTWCDMNRSLKVYFSLSSMVCLLKHRGD